MDNDKVNIDEVNMQLGVLKLLVLAPSVGEQCLRCLDAGVGWDQILELVPNGRSLVSRLRKRVGDGGVGKLDWKFVSCLNHFGEDDVDMTGIPSKRMNVQAGEVASVDALSRGISPEGKSEVIRSVTFTAGSIDDAPESVRKQVDLSGGAEKPSEAPQRPKMKMPDGLDDYGLKPRTVKDDVVESDLSYVMKNWGSIWLDGYPDPTFEDYEGEVASVLSSNAGVVLSKTDFKKVVDRLKGGEG